MANGGCGGSGIYEDGIIIKWPVMMDAVDYLKERNRGCLSFEGCDGCRFQSETGCERGIMEIDNPEKAVLIVAEWAADHPFMTNAEKFKEVFGVRPQNVCPPKGADICEDGAGDCVECMKWWNREYKDPEAEE